MRSKSRSPVGHYNIPYTKKEMDEVIQKHGIKIATQIYVTRFEEYNYLVRDTSK